MFTPAWTVRQLLASDREAMRAFLIESVGLVMGSGAVWLAGIVVSLGVYLTEMSHTVSAWEGCDDGTAGGCGIAIFIGLSIALVIFVVLWFCLAMTLLLLWFVGRCLRAPWPVLAVIVAVGLAGLSTLLNYSTAQIAQDALLGALFVAGVQVFWGGGAALLAPSLARKLSV